MTHICAPAACGKKQVFYSQGFYIKHQQEDASHLSWRNKKMEKQKYGSYEEFCAEYKVRFLIITTLLLIVWTQ